MSLTVGDETSDISSHGLKEVSAQKLTVKTHIPLSIMTILRLFGLASYSN
jgi:hypothetical protein